MVMINKSKSVSNEADLTRYRIAELKDKPIVGNFDATHLKAINRYILQDIPSYFCGEYRMSTNECRACLQPCNQRE